MTVEDGIIVPGMQRPARWLAGPGEPPRWCQPFGI